MKKLFLLLGTLGAFIFALTFGVSTYAATDENVEETPNNEVVEEDKTNALEDFLDKLDLSEEQVKEIASVIGSYTNERVEQLTISLYASLGVAGILLALVFVVIVVLAVKNTKNNATIEAVVNGVYNKLTAEQKKNADELVENVKNNNEYIKNLLTDVLDSVTEKKASKFAEQITKVNEKLGLTKSAPKVE